MSDDRLNKLETQMNQMIELMNKLMDEFIQQRNDFIQHRNEFTQHRNDFIQHRKEFADVVSVVIATEKKVDGLEKTVTNFQKETRDNFERVFRENSVTNRRIDLLTPTVSEMQARVQELEKRMEKVEGQIAA